MAAIIQPPDILLQLPQMTQMTQMTQFPAAAVALSSL